MYEARWDGDTLRIWDCEKHVPVCGVYLAKNPRQRVELARVIARALNDHSVEKSRPKPGRSTAAYFQGAGYQFENVQ